MIKLIISDLDGTALDDNKKLDSGLFEVVPKLKEKGILFTIASGRNEELLGEYIDSLNIDIPYIVNNGGNIYQNHKCLVNDCLDNKYNNFIVNTLYENNIPFRLFSVEDYYAYSDSDFFTGRLKSHYISLKKYSPDLDLSNHHIYKITSDYNDHLDAFDSVYKKIVENCKGISYLQAEKNIYCISSKTANKGDGLLKLCEMLKIDSEEVMVFGDHGTDLPLLEKAGIAVAVENGEDDAKKIADYICKDNNSNGVSGFIKEYFNI